MATGQQIISNFGGTMYITVQANGGSVTVERQIGTAWIVVNTFTEDGAWPIAVGRGSTRITAIGNALYQVGA